MTAAVAWKESRNPLRTIPISTFKASSELGLALACMHRPYLDQYAKFRRQGGIVVMGHVSVMKVLVGNLL